MVRVVIFESLIICRASHVTKNSKCPSTKIIIESILNYSGLFSQKSRQHIRRVSNRYLFQFLHQAILNFYSRDLPSIVLMTSIMVLWDQVQYCTRQEEHISSFNRIYFEDLKCLLSVELFVYTSDKYCNYCFVVLLSMYNYLRPFVTLLYLKMPRVSNFILHIIPI